MSSCRKKLAALKRQFVHLPSEASREVVAVEREEDDDDEEKLEAQCDYIENHILPLFTKSSSLEVGYAGNPCRPCKKIQFIELSVTTGSLTKVKHWILSLFSKLS